MKFDYISERNLYYIGIFLLVLCSLPSIGFVEKWIVPYLNKEMINIPFISLIAIFVGIEAFRGFKWRAIG